MSCGGNILDSLVQFSVAASDLEYDQCIRRNSSSHFVSVAVKGTTVVKPSSEGLESQLLGRLRQIEDPTWVLERVRGQLELLSVALSQ